ncbi:MAG: YihY/virulence factor BrkB family protein [Propionibacteriaceae bacterium]|nr:YihY/virulence factor BrkB family protein [Propionibacteriaceae bacterium]
MDAETEATVAKERTAPAPDDPAKPAWPWQLGARSWRYVLRRTWSEFWYRHILDNAGNLAYMSIQSLFPGLLAILAGLTLFGQGTAAVEWIIEFLHSVAPTTVVELVSDPLRQVAAAAGADWVLGIALVGVLWAASGYVSAFGRSANRIHGVVEGRPIWQIIPYNLLVTLLMLVFGVFTLLAVLLSAGIWEVVLRYLNLDIGPLEALRASRWIVLAVAALAAVLALYRATPNVRQARLRWSIPGALFAMVATVLAILGYTLWVGVFGRLPATFGIVGSFIILLLGLWIMNIALLIGVVLNTEIERARLLAAGFAAERDLLVQPRNTRMIQARGQEEDWLAERAGELRAQASGHSQPSRRPRKSSDGSPS